MTKKNKTWMVRAGEGAYLLDEFLGMGVIQLGWNDLGLIPPDSSKADIKKMFWESYKDSTEGYVSMSVGQLWRFYHDFAIGDAVVTYDPGSRAYYMGTIKSDYQFSDKYSYHHIRKVEWEEGPHYRDELTTASKNTLGAIMTIFEIKDEVKEDLIKSHPRYLSEEEIADFEEAERRLMGYEEEEEERIREGIVSRSNEFIKDELVKLSWQQMEELTAGILRAMDYKTRMTSKGSDLGSDIHASPDGLGMFDPRIKAEVKHKVKSKDKVGADSLRNFIGGLRNERGLYVSTTGFTKEAYYEAERANFPITLIDGDRLVELLVEYYDKIEPEIKALVPLRKIYWPA